MLYGIFVRKSRVKLVSRWTFLIIHVKSSQCVCLSRANNISLYCNFNSLLITHFITVLNFDIINIHFMPFFCVMFTKIWTFYFHMLLNSNCKHSGDNFNVTFITIFTFDMIKNIRKFIWIKNKSLNRKWSFGWAGDLKATSRLISIFLVWLLIF